MAIPILLATKWSSISWFFFFSVTVSCLFVIFFVVNNRFLLFLCLLFPGSVCLFPWWCHSAGFWICSVLSCVPWSWSPSSVLCSRWLGLPLGLLCSAHLDCPLTALLKIPGSQVFHVSKQTLFVFVKITSNNFLKIDRYLKMSSFFYLNNVV